MSEHFLPQKEKKHTVLFTVRAVSQFTVISAVCDLQQSLCDVVHKLSNIVIQLYSSLYIHFVVQYSAAQSCWIVVEALAYADLTRTFIRIFLYHENDVEKRFDCHQLNERCSLRIIFKLKYKWNFKRNDNKTFIMSLMEVFMSAFDF